MDTSKQMLAMKANKKLLQRHLQESTGKVVHNIAATITSAPVPNIAATIASAPVGGSILQTLVNDMRKEPGSFTDIVTNDCNELNALYYQSSSMQRKFPELLLLDATYKLNYLWMPLYVLMVENQRGESGGGGVIGRKRGARHDISSHGSVCAPQRLCSRTMRDGRPRYAGEGCSRGEVTTGSHPDLHLSCPAHLPTRGDREKMAVSQEQQLEILSILRRLVYANSAKPYTTAYVELVGLEINKLLAYYNKNWHPIREEWVQGMKHTKFSMLNSTNNRVESLNNHLKCVITKYSNIVTFFLDLKLMLGAMETERNHRALQMCQKPPAASQTMNCSSTRTY